MEEIKTIMGTETEFAVVPRAGTWSDDKSPKKMAQFINYLQYILNQEYESRKSDYELNRTSLLPKINWWDEKIKETEEQEIARCLGLTGEYHQNGSRVYVDGAHPEYSTPECLNPFELIAYEKAGEIIMRNAVNEVEKRFDAEADLLKNNWDYHRSSYSCHENYLVSRALFKNIVANEHIRSFRSYPLTPEQIIWIAHLVTRQIFTGSGRLDTSKKWPECFSLSQRSPFVQYLETLDTTFHRAIVNSRNRPYADEKQFARLHVICGDSNIADWSNLLKIGPSRLILLMLEDVIEKKFPVPRINQYIFDKNPKKIFSAIQNPHQKIKTRENSTSPLDMQLMLLMDVNRWLEWKKKEEKNIPWADKIIQYWAYATESYLHHPENLDTKLDHRIKKTMFEKNLAMGKNLSQIKSLDYSYHIVGKSRSLVNELIKRDLMEQIISEEKIAQALVTPPQSRAYLRATLNQNLRNVGEKILTTWHKTIIFTPAGHQFVEMSDPRDKNQYSSNSKSLLQSIEKLLSKEEKGKN